MGSYHNRDLSRISRMNVLRINFSTLVLLWVLPFGAAIGASRRSRPLRADCWNCERLVLSSPRESIKTQAKKEIITSNLSSLIYSRKLLEERFLFNGLGSAPPQCNLKCGSCNPCKPVHVPIQPGFLKATEYYPEAWRCQCGKKLYMP